MDDPPHTVWAHHPEAAFSLALVFALVVFPYCLPAVLPGRFNGRTPGHVMCSTRLVCLDGKSVVAE